MKVHVHEMNLMKNQIIDFKSFEILKEKVARKKKTHFFNHLTKRIMFNMFKMSSLGCRSHVHEIILSKNMFGCPLKFILKLFGDFYVLTLNQNIHAQLCMNVKTHHHHMNYFKLEYSNLLI
jgi:hypothetical protein